MRGAYAAVLLAAAALAEAQVGVASAQSAGGFVRDRDLWLATSANVIGTGLFITRVHAPSVAPVLGYGTQLMGAPILASSIADIAGKRTDFSTWAGIGYAAWALGAATIDHVLRVEYRDPARPEILIPYVAGYYAAIGALSAAQYRNGYVAWAVAGGTCLITVASSFYARAKGADKR